MSAENPAAPLELTVFALLFILRNLTEPLVAPGKRDGRRPGMTSAPEALQYTGRVFPAPCQE